jgi:hypothetical protein
MTGTSILRRMAGGSLVAFALAAALPAIEALAPERFMATAVSIATPGPTGAGMVEMVVERYSTDAERDRLLKALIEKGPEKLLDTLQDMPRVGYIRTPNSIGYDLKYARKMPLDEGGEQIVMATDRYISFWEAANRPRTIDYPFTLIEMRLGPDGVGEGKMSLFTKIYYDKKKNQIVLENYASQPVLLTQVRRESTSASNR